MPASVSPPSCLLLLMSRHNALQASPTFRLLDDNKELHEGGPSVVGSSAGRGRSRPMGGVAMRKPTRLWRDRGDHSVIILTERHLAVSFVRQIMSRVAGLALEKGAGIRTRGDLRTYF